MALRSHNGQQFTAWNEAPSGQPLELPHTDDEQALNDLADLIADSITLAIIGAAWVALVVMLASALPS